VDAVHALGHVPLVGRHGDAVSHGDPLDYEHAVAVEDLADGFDFVALRIDFDVTRLQRAGEGARQSAAGGRDDVVERRRVRLQIRR
jgi:hypothetical protein